MRKFLVIAAAALFVTAPAFACSCQQGMTAQSVMADHSLSLVDVTVKGMNMNNRQSALQINTVRQGFLTAQNIRAKFDTSTCGVIPKYRQNMTVLIRAEADGSYSIAGQCELNAVKGQ